MAFRGASDREIGLRPIAGAKLETCVVTEWKRRARPQISRQSRILPKNAAKAFQSIWIRCPDLDGGLFLGQRRLHDSGAESDSAHPLHFKQSGN